MTKCLITGAAGFIGYHLASEIAKDPQNQVICVDNFSRGENDKAYRELCSKGNVLGLEVDLSDQNQYRKLPDDVDFIYHMAALNGTQNFYERPMEVLKSCTLPTIFLLEHYSGNANNIKRFIYAGTSESYASTVSVFNWDIPTDETVPLSIDDPSNPRWSYAASKIHGEVATLIAGRHAGLSTTIIRFHNVYGPRMGDKHVIPDFYMRAKRGVFELYGHENTRSFLYIDDAVRAVLELAHLPRAHNEIVNVGSDRELTMLELAESMMNVIGKEGEIMLHGAPKGSVVRRVPNLEKITELISFQPKIDLMSGLRMTADYYWKD